MVERIRTYRDHTAEILALSSSGAKKTHLVYKVNINFNLIKPLLTTLCENGLLDRKERLFFTTDKGQQFLYHFENMKGLMNNAG